MRFPGLWATFISAGSLLRAACVLSIRAGRGGVHLSGPAWVVRFLTPYSLSFQAQTLSAAVLLPGSGMILVALVFIGYALVRRLGLGYLALGGLAWLVAVVLKFLWAIPFNGPIFQILTSRLPEPLGSILFYIYVGALTGVFEVALVWLVLRYTRLARVPYKKALAFGIGFGALEALLLGLSSLGSALVGLLAPDQLPPATLAQLALANNALYGLAPIVERIATIFVHIFANLLLFYGVVVRQPRWFWAAFIYKTALDSVAAFAQFWGVNTLGHIWTIEAIVVLFGLLGWWGIRWMAQCYPDVPPGSQEGQASPSRH
jgi:uncharacterized membrane protein YhfC